MINQWVTFTEFLLEQKKIPHGLLLLLTQISEAGKIIGAHVQKSGISNLEGSFGSQNTFGEDQQKLDVFSDELLVRLLVQLDVVYCLVSEERGEPIYASGDGGEYVVYFDPLDGSSNIDVNISIGTIFSIYRRPRDSKDILFRGKDQVASGYILYGSSVMLVFCDGHSVNGFTLDPSIGTYLLSHKNIQIPHGEVYSLNEAYSPFYDSSLKKYLESIKKDGSRRLRFVGSMVSDVHRTLLKGGIFLYPSDSRHPDGKLRLMLEVNPLSFVIVIAGGQAVSGIENVLELTPKNIHQRVPIVLGDSVSVSEYLSFVSE